MGTYANVADLPLTIEGHELEGLERPFAGGFTRRTTVVRLRGDGHQGVGEDVVYDERGQLAFQEAGARLELAGRFTLDAFSQLLDRVELFPEAPALEAYHHYRRWAFESAALDLALRQAGRSLADALGKTPRPVTFVVSLRLPEPPSTEPLRRWLALYPTLRFKLDPTSSWDDDLVAELAAMEIVDTVDLKGAYRGTPVDQPADPALYTRVARALPNAWIEDPDLTPETERVLAAHRDRVTWDAPIHSVEDIEGLPVAPRALNIKPSRFGTVRALFEAYDFCAERGIAMYGGGQAELGPGRGQIQYLASLFHPDTPNDVAPRAYNDPDPQPGLPTSPLEPTPRETGFYWD
jgi:L-alanine-DL-glutamate epimerase-like enolase superfamily enzyme